MDTEVEFVPELLPYGNSGTNHVFSNNSSNKGQYIGNLVFYPTPRDYLKDFQWFAISRIITLTSH
jgi:hypothetical protein